jgi:hypothetical protein
MFKEPVLLNKEAHKFTTISPVQNYKHAKSFNAIVLSAQEMSEACKHYPVFFIQEEENSEVVPVAILGVKEDENLFVNRAGNWEKEAYIPAMFRAYPFSLTKNQEGLYSIVIDNQYSELNKEGGERIFNDDGELSEYGLRVQMFLQELYSNIESTKSMLKKLSSLDLLKRVDIDIEKDDKKLKLSGLMQIDDEKLNSLRDKDLLELTKSGVMMIICKHLISLTNIKRLASKI